jgi:hypothetical protein
MRKPEWEVREEKAEKKKSGEGKTKKGMAAMVKLSSDAQTIESATPG